MKNNEIYIVYNEFNATISTNGSHAKNNMSIANSLYLHVLLRICYMDIVKKIHCFLKPSFTVFVIIRTNSRHYPSSNTNIRAWNIHAYIALILIQGLKSHKLIFI